MKPIGRMDKKSDENLGVLHEGRNAGNSVIVAKWKGNSEIGLMWF